MLKYTAKLQIKPFPKIPKITLGQLISEWVIGVFQLIQIVQLYHGENTLIFNEMMRSALV